LDRRTAEKKPASDKELTAYASFLEGIASRKEGQTPASQTFLADAFLAIRRPAQAVTLLEKVIASPDADPSTRTFARILLARAQSLTGKHDAAKSMISELLKENPNSRDVIFEKGQIYEAAKDWPGAIKHWQWFLDRLKRVQPRPVELYQVTDRLSGLYIEWSKTVGADEKKKLLAMAYRLPSYLLETDRSMPAEWRKTLEARVATIKPLSGS
jgi:tetratricopeptide (TPR) repeat protein